MKIELKKLTLLNFKGVRSLTIPFSQVTNIRGMNGTGKTTVFDSFLWLLFGKDSSDRTTFEVKTLDPTNEPYHRLSHEVEAELLVDGEVLTLKKTYKEKWVKKAGSKDHVFSGHTNEFTWNDVPVNEKEFTAKIASYINEAQFKLLTNLAFFNTVMKWQDRRSLLIQLAGGLSDIEVARSINKDGSYDHLIAALTSKKSIDDYKKEIASKISKIKSDSDNLPSRIDEAKRSLPEEADYAAIEAQIKARTEDLHTTEAILNNKSAAHKAHQNKITAFVREQGELARKITVEEDAIRNKVKDATRVRENRLADLKRERVALTDERSSLTASWNSKNRELANMVAQHMQLTNDYDQVGLDWDAADAEQFQMDPNACACPACKQDLPNAFQIAEELESNFNRSKAAKLKTLTERGQLLANEIKLKASSIDVVKTEMENIKAKGLTQNETLELKTKEISVFEEEHSRISADELALIEDTIKTDEAILAYSKRIKDLHIEIETPMEEDNAEAAARKKNLTDEINALYRQLDGKDQRAKILQRIADLEKAESESAQALADLEGLQFSLLEFDKAKMNLLEAKINGKFELVKFRLFDRQINGGESPSCVTLIDGVPYADANTASKINASLDIINVFSKHYGVQAPVFIDNRESVVNIIDTDMQIVNLIVSEKHKALTIESRELELA